MVNVPPPAHDPAMAPNGPTAADAALLARNSRNRESSNAADVNNLAFVSNLAFMIMFVSWMFVSWNAEKVVST
jgi:hypothetical protein